MLNKAMLIGNVGNDPEVRTTTNGSKVCNFSVATNEHWKDKATGEKKERTEWHRVTVFNDRLIDNMIEPYVKKGASLYVEGQIRTRKWTDSDGNDKYTTEIVVDGFSGAVSFVGPKHDNAEPGAREPRGEATPAPALDDDIPF